MLANLPAALLRGRAAAESLMVDTCRVERVTGSTTDQDTGDVVETTDTIYEGKCRFQANRATGAGNKDEGEAYLYVDQLVLQLPMSATGVANEDRVICLTSALDDELPDTEFVVHGLSMKTHATMRRIAIRLVTN